VHCIADPLKRRKLLDRDKACLRDFLVWQGYCLWGYFYKIGDEKRRCSIKEALSNRLDAKNRAIEAAFFFQLPERCVAREFASVDITLGQPPASLVPAMEFTNEENRPGSTHNRCDS
jgi:hypothetical protein